MSAPVPARTWHSRSRATDYTLNVEQTDVSASGVQLWIGDADGDGASVLLDRTQTGELVTDLLRRLALIGGRHAAVQAAADPSIAAQCSPRVVDVVIYCGEDHPTLECTSCGREAEHDGPCRGIHPRTGMVRDWYAADAAIAADDPVDREVLGVRAGADALRGPESAGTGTPGGLTPTDHRSPGSGDAGGAR